MATPTEKLDNPADVGVAIGLFVPPAQDLGNASPKLVIPLFENVCVPGFHRSWSLSQPYLGG